VGAREINVVYFAVCFKKLDGFLGLLFFFWRAAAGSFGAVF
jgi:hypothetical protein